MIAILTACLPSTPQLQIEPTNSSIVTPQNVQRVTLEESKAAFDSGAAVFGDVRGAEILLEHGFTRVNPILGGFNAWKAAGYPVESSQ